MSEPPWMNLPTPSRPDDWLEKLGARPGSMRFGGWTSNAPKVVLVVDEGEPMEQYYVGAKGEVEFGDGVRMKTVVTAIDGRQVTFRIVGDVSDD